MFGLAWGNFVTEQLLERNSWMFFIAVSGLDQWGQSKKVKIIDFQNLKWHILILLDHINFQLIKTIIIKNFHNKRVTGNDLQLNSGGRRMKKEIIEEEWGRKNSTQNREIFCMMIFFRKKNSPTNCGD